MFNKFATLFNGMWVLVSAISSSSGTNDANKIVATNSGGVIDPSFLRPRFFSEALTPGNNTVSNLTYTPDQNYNVQLLVNGKSESTFSGAFSVSGTAILWNSGNAGYNLESTFEVIARYTTMG